MKEKMIFNSYDKYGSYVADSIPGWQHEYMAEFYIEYISDGLAALHPELSSQKFIDHWSNSGFYLPSSDQFINWDWDQFYTALAWQGLESTEEFEIDAWEDRSSEIRTLLNEYQGHNNESNKCN